MNKITPWKIENGTLQLLPWEYGAGDVLVTVDVFESWEGLVLAESSLPAWRYAAHSRETRDIPLRPMEYSEVLSDLFAHIDNHPETIFTLRTLHPERVRECWPAVPEVGEDDWCDGSGPESCPGCGNCVRYRPNVTLSLGPLATQADADRLVPEMLPLADLCGGLELALQPTEKVDLTEIADFVITTNPGSYSRVSDTWLGYQWTFPVTRIRVDGDRDENVRFIEQQAIAAGVAFALNWESEVANG